MSKKSRSERLQHTYHLSREDAEELLLEVAPSIKTKKKAKETVETMSLSLCLMPEGVVANA